MSIIQRAEKLDFSKVAFEKGSLAQDFSNGFVAKIKLENLPQSNQRELLVQTPYFCVHGVRLHKKNDAELFSRREKSDCVNIYADEQGFVYLLEITAEFSSPYQDDGLRVRVGEVCVDLVLNLFNAVEKQAYVYFDGMKFAWAFEDEERNCDYIFGSIVKKECAPFVKEGVEFSISRNFSDIEKKISQDCLEKSINFYSPRGYNAWAGDVMNFYHNGKYHLLYLHDRHHHGSRWGGGAHSVYHLTTENFVDWVECPPVVTLNESWQSVGTGTMFFHNGNYYFSHGWHTARVLPETETASYLIKLQASSEKEISPVSYSEIKEKGLYPSGANYWVSKDGVQFERGDCVFHISENPSLYLEEDNSLFMFAGYGTTGVWRAKSIADKWIFDANAQVPCSRLNPTTECPSMFELNGYKYLIMGFTGYFKTEKNGSVYIDQAIEGIDIYDGLAVPMVAKTKENRLILAGWLNGLGWASMIVHRELVQGEEGRLFMKWMPELAPKKESLTLVCKNEKIVDINERKSYYFEWSVQANKNTQMLVRFLGEKQTVLIIDAKRKTVQFNDSEQEILPFYEWVQRGGDVHGLKEMHKRSVNFAIGQVDNVQAPYKVKMQIYYEKKSDNVVIDCEIGGKRTIVSNRAGERFSKVQLEAREGEVEDICVYEL